MTARDKEYVEEIIKHLKRVENDYGIDLTPEMEWLRGVSKEEPVSEDLDEAAIQFATDTETGKVDVVKQSSFFWGAKWQKQQMMAKAIDVEVKIDAGGYPYIPAIELYDYDNDVPLAKAGDKVKVKIVKKD